MPNTLERVVEPVPTVAPSTGLKIVSELFAQDPDLKLVVVAGDEGRRPLGIIERRHANVEGDTAAAACVEIAVVDAATDVEKAMAAAVEAGLRPFETGMIVTKYDTFQGFASGSRLGAWFADRLSRARSERDAARRALTKATEQRLLFLAHMGHELRTPLNAVIGYADLVRSQVHGPLEPPPYRAAVDAIHDAGSHLLAVINAMLDLAKIDARSMQLNEQRFDVADAVHAAAAMVQSAAEHRGVRISARLHGALPRILADEQIVRQILVNLLSNAVKFSPAGGLVTVTADLDRRGALRLVVKDQGPGIKPEDIDKVMQPFHQVESGGLARHGTGLGLPLVKAFAELHDGGFQILSADGKGTRAVVTLPAARVSGARPSGQCEFIFTRPSLRA